MSTSLKTLKSREAKTVVPPVAPLVSPAAPAVETETVLAYRPDCWGFKFWLGCVGVLVLLHVIDWVNALLVR